MPDSIAGGGMRFDFSFKSRSDEEKSEEPLAIAILGDFGSHTSGAENKLSDPIRVDCDNFDEVFAKIGVTLDLPPSAKRAWEINLRFRTLEDFHPEQFLNQLKPLANLAELRAKLLHPESMDAAAKELQEALKIGALPSETPPATSTESTEEMLGRLLGKPASEPDRVSSPVLLANRLIRQIIGANVPDVHPQQSQLVALADTE